MIWSGTGATVGGEGLSAPSAADLGELKTAEELRGNLGVERLGVVGGGVCPEESSGGGSGMPNCFGVDSELVVPLLLPARGDSGVRKETAIMASLEGVKLFSFVLHRDFFVAFSGIVPSGKQNSMSVEAFISEFCGYWNNTFGVRFGIIPCVEDDGDTGVIPGELGDCVGLDESPEPITRNISISGMPVRSLSLGLEWCIKRLDLSLAVSIATASAEKVASSGTPPLGVDSGVPSPGPPCDILRRKPGGEPLTSPSRNDLHRDPLRDIVYISVLSSLLKPAFSVFFAKVNVKKETKIKSSLARTRTSKRNLKASLPHSQSNGKKIIKIKNSTGKKPC